MKENKNLQQLCDDVIDRNKWADFIKRFIDVLWINIFLVDYSGRLLISFPDSEREKRHYGSKFLERSFGFTFSQESPRMLLEEFKPYGDYLEAKCPLDLHAFAVPIRGAEKEAIAYLIVGPVILNQKLSAEDYLQLAQKTGLQTEGLLDSIQEIRVVSFVTMKAILDLLSQILKDITALNIERKKLSEGLSREPMSNKILEAAQEIYTTIHIDELLITILDIALNLTQAECGSIMTLDEEKKNLRIRVARGVDNKRIQDSKLKIGEGIAGFALQNNESLVIGHSDPDSRIQHLLKRPEIKKSVIIPLSVKDNVFGVLNIHTKRGLDKISHNLDNLKYLSKLISIAIYSM